MHGQQAYVPSSAIASVCLEKSQSLAKLLKHENKSNKQTKDPQRSRHDPSSLRIDSFPRLPLLIRKVERKHPVLDPRENRHALRCRHDLNPVHPIESAQVVSGLPRQVGADAVLRQGAVGEDQEAEGIPRPTRIGFCVDANPGKLCGRRGEADAVPVTI
ncbi:hypothetical protein S7711_10672 [Stachybotrys chartarum IBT 7711]|uniref:Uncharacterized protein n=1 Tax=Stachybotrys chartarum (strain CBS 109288 / IBT 7711) TaxID=1280523 RepID=A0A084B8E7_STACB|nr:hypothetical protein S7711_10672 [Stachybotrys chartarum IBT 7711]KFA55395.1 hypothetical protein S40293_10988 [Stachybotrys chartarum IBT 40293]